ncbi:uncharacterized protein Dvar_27860 [Desulfosarcina variabilis str. Montpellier]
MPTNKHPEPILIAPFVSLHGIGRLHSRGHWDLVNRLPGRSFLRMVSDAVCGNLPVRSPRIRT